MALIGQSKNEGLYQRVTEEGSKYRELRYLDVSDTEPLISGYHREFDPGFTPGIPGVKEEAGGAGIISDVQRAVTARIDDTARIMKLLTKRQGIEWEAHNIGLAAIQNNLDKKRGRFSEGSNVAGEEGFWQSFLGQTLQNIGQGLLDTARVTAGTLAQTAIAGTGEHFSAWYDNRTYIGENAAEYALSSGKVSIKDISYHQLPYGDSEEIQKAQLPSRRQGKLEDIRQFYGNGLTLEATKATGGGWDLRPNLEYKDLVDTSEDGRLFGPKEYSIVSGDSDEIQKAQLPAPGRTVQYISEAPEKVSLDEGASQVLQYGLHYGDKPNLNRNDYSEQYTYVEEHSGSVTKFGVRPEMPETARPEEPNSKGPWKPEGALTLKAAKTPKADKPASDSGAHAEDPENLVQNGVNSGTRVDNGRIDLIPFWIRAITPGGRPIEDLGYLFFEANLDSYSDNYDASWKGTQYVGRADKFWTYEGFDRQISFAFKMVAHSKAHLKPIYNRLNGLLSMTAPNYSEGVFMRGTLAEITIGDLLSRQLGFIKSVGLKWETDYMWETDEGTIRVPHVLDVSIQFTPIHQFIPQTRKRYFELYGEGNEGEPSFTGNGRLYTTYKTVTE